MVCKYGFGEEYRKRYQLEEQVARAMCRADGHQEEYTWRWFSWTRRHHVETWRRYHRFARVACNQILGEPK